MSKFLKKNRLTLFFFYLNISIIIHHRTSIVNNKNKKMNRLKKLLLLFLISLLNFPLLFAEVKSGSELCREVYNFLDKASLAPKTQSIVVNGENDFPYNIIVHFPGKISTQNTFSSKKEGEKQVEASTPDGIFIFSMDDVLTNKNLILHIAEFIKTSSLDFDIDFVFTYGDDKIQKNILENSIERIYGLDTFIEELDTSKDYIAVIVELNEEKYSVISSSNNYSSSSYFVAGFYNLFLKNSKNPVLPWNYISKLFRSNFTYDRELSAFFKEGIPAIKILLEDRENSNLLILQGAINLIKTGKEEPLDQHFFLLKVFGHYFRLSEHAIMITLEIIIFLCLFYFFLLLFVNAQRKKIAWSSVKYVWYVVPISFLICLFCFFTGRYATFIFKVFSSETAKMYGNSIIQIGLSVFFSTLFYFFTLLYNPYFHIRAIDFLIVISSFINQSIFILVDISLFPLFFTVFILSILCLYIKNNVIHIILLFLMIWCFIPVAHTTTNFAVPEFLQNTLMTNPLSSIALSLTLCPILLVYFRILAGLIRNQKSALSTIRTGIIFNIVLIIALSVTGIIRTHQIKKRNIVQNIELTQIDDENINFVYSDRIIFDDIIRTITITLPENVCECNVILEGNNKNPILYSDNDFELLSNNSIYFKIPQNPPSTMNFSYGCTNENSTIKISAFFATEKENSYNVCTRIINIGE